MRLLDRSEVSLDNCLDHRVKNGQGRSEETVSVPRLEVQKMD